MSNSTETVTFAADDKISAVLSGIAARFAEVESKGKETATALLKGKEATDALAASTKGLKTSQDAIASGMATYRDAMKETAQASQTASTEAEALALAFAELEQEVKEGKGFAELNSQLRNLRDEVVEFGGSLDDQKAALAAVNKEARALKMPIGLVSNAMRKLVDESEDAKGATEKLNLALRLSRTALLKTEDAGKLVGQAMKGETAALRQLGPAWANVADELDKVTDKSLRAKLTLEALENATKTNGAAASRLGQVFGGLSNDIAQVNAKLAQTGIPGLSLQNILLGLTGVVAGLATAITGQLKKALEAYVAVSKEATYSAEENKKATQDLEVAVGAYLHKRLEVNQAEQVSRARKAALAETVRGLGNETDTFGGKLLWLVGVQARLLTGYTHHKFAIQGIIGAWDSAIGTSEKLTTVLSTDFKRVLAESIDDTFNLTNNLNGLIDAGLEYAKVDAKLTKELKAVKDGINKDFESHLYEETHLKKKRRGGGGRRKKDPVAEAMKKATKAREKARKAAEKAEAAAFKKREAWRVRLEKKEEDLALRMEQRAAETDAKIKAARVKRESEESRKSIKKEFEELKEYQDSLQDGITTYMSSAITETYNLVDALATANMTLSEFKYAAADSGGDILANMGLDILAEGVGDLGVYLGGVVAAWGEAWKAFITSPWTAAVAGAALIGAGVLLKKHYGSGSAPTKGSAKAADSAAASQIAAMGKKMFEEGGREDQQVTLYIDDYEALNGHIEGVNRTARRSRRTATRNSL